MQTNTKSRVYAGFFVRLAAFLVDLIIVNTGLLLIRLPMWILSINSPDNILVRDFIFQYSVVDIVVYLANAAYFVLMTYYTGATLGKKAFQIRVVSAEERKMTLFEVIYRETIGRFLSSVIMNLGYLLIFVDKEHRGAHDILSDTCVVYYHEKKVYVHAPMNYRNMNAQPGYTVPPAGANMGQQNVPPLGPNMGQQNVPPMGPNMGQSNVPPMGPNMGQQNIPPMGSNMGQQNVPPMGSNMEPSEASLMETDAKVEEASPMGFVEGIQEKPETPFVKAQSEQDAKADVQPKAETDVQSDETVTNTEVAKKDFSMPAGYFSMDDEKKEAIQEKTDETIE